MIDPEFSRKIRKAIRESAPMETTSTEVADIFEAVMDVVREVQAEREVAESEAKQNRSHIQDEWTNERYS